MRLVLLSILSLLVGSIVVIAVLLITTKPVVTIQKLSPRSIIPFSIEKAPSQSLTASVTSLSGDVSFESRSATTPAQLLENSQILQGEKIITGTNGTTVLTFPNGYTLTVAPNSELEIIQTLPSNIVFHQTQGSVEYLGTSVVSPIAIRSLHLLTQLHNAKTTYVVDPETATITIDVHEGTAKLAYNDLNFVSTVQTVESPNQVIFDDATRTITVESLTQ